MSRDYFEDLPPELIAQLSPLLSPGPLSALVLTCRRLHEILQPELEAALTPKLGRELLLDKAAGKYHTVAKLLSPPHLINPNGYGPESKRMDIAALLLEAGADTKATMDLSEDLQPLHLAAFNKDLEMMKLLLLHGAPIDATFGDAGKESALHYACTFGHLEMARLLLDHGADLESRGALGTALGFAVHRGDQDMVVFLLENGANAEVTVPLFGWLLDGRPPDPRDANLLYIAMELRHPPDRYLQLSRKKDGLELPEKWIGLPLPESKKKLMAVLLAYGASKDTALHTIVQHLTALAQEAQYTEDEYIAVVTGMLNEAENAILDRQDIQRYPLVSQK
ncbi:ankyrin repeat-containing domain protein [Rhodocollybia butyracea]|uniref:Ankyrin repeat-containing domain protein n=1 Tax=Rhodocollybia butyracea TaxID=206335 RepID=A0A9P5PDH0_9AGAR|nr:ankyrin repeat-containing domain protein [Rhodocollybia butyracea]